MKANHAVAALAGTGFIIAGFFLYNGPAAESGIGLDADATAPAKRVIHEALMVRPGQAAKPAAAPATRAPAAAPNTSAAQSRATPSNRIRIAVIDTLLTRERPVGSDGTVDHTEIVRTAFKYPLIRVDQRISASGSLLSQQEMVADHVVVQLQEGETQSDLEQVLSRQPFTAYVRHAAHTPGLFLVAFDGSDPATMGRVIQSLQGESQVIKYSEPDLIVHAF